MIERDGKTVKNQQQRTQEQPTILTRTLNTRQLGAAIKSYRAFSVSSIYRMPHRALPKEELTAQVAKDMKPFPLLQNYLSSNVRWANDVNQAEPAFFPLVSTGQVSAA